MKVFFNIILKVIIIYLVIDVVMFLVWALSAQYPVDGFYVGAVTKMILQFIFF